MIKNFISAVLCSVIVFAIVIFFTFNILGSDYADYILEENFAKSSSDFLSNAYVVGIKAFEFPLKYCGEIIPKYIKTAFSNIFEKAENVIYPKGNPNSPKSSP